MARSDLLLSLVRAGSATSDPRFRGAVEALIAEERAKNHDMLADQLAAAYNGGANKHQPQPSQAWSVIGDLIYELNPERGLSDLMLSQAVTQQCRELVEEQQRAELLRSYGLAPRHRVLLIGPPGNGKTSLAHALAHELMVPLLAIRYEGLIGSYLGETASRVRKVFDYARQRRCVLFFDEFDTIGKERGDAHETGEIKRVVSTLLLQMDEVPAHVVIVTATNHSELLDRAVWRRFQIRLELPPPNSRQIEEYINRLLSGLKLAEGLGSLHLGTRFRGANYSEIEDLVRDIARRIVLEGPDADPKRIVQGRLSTLNLNKGAVHPGRMASPKHSTRRKGPPKKKRRS